MRILGIDPGSRITGYGVIEKKRSDLTLVTFGEIKPARNASLSGILLTIYNALSEIIRNTAPDVMAIEDIFYGKNVKSLIKQGHVRGISILACSHSSKRIFEYTPLEIKKAVVGYGKAEKNQMQIMIKAILKMNELPPQDAADALSVAVCHANFMKENSI
jgi:crossover junction endodeoxyribonuclease RuvC